jgi:hypothetical protein
MRIGGKTKPNSQCNENQQNQQNNPEKTRTNKTEFLCKIKQLKYQQSIKHFIRPKLLCIFT